MRVTTMLGRRQVERLGHISEGGAEAATRGVAGADLGEQPQRLGEARVDGGSEQAEGQERARHGGRGARRCDVVS